MGNGIHELCIRHSAAQQRTCVKPCITVETELQKALRRQTHAVARMAEFVLHRVDKADRPRKPRRPYIGGGPLRYRALVRGLPDRQECAKRILQPCTYLVHRHAAIVLRPRTADRHELDKAYINRMCAGNRGERGELLIVHAHDWHAVHLDREPLLLGEARECLHHRAEHRPPRDREERPAVERIEAEVHRIETCIQQLIHHRTEQDAVRRERHRLNARDLLQTAHKARNVTPHEWLAACQAHLAHA